jgi:dienelactone hydrolase
LCRRIEARGSRGEVDVYQGIGHGFAFACRATYHHAAERHWARLLDLFNRSLALH